MAHRSALVLALFASAIFSCSDETASQTACTPGDSEPCACTDGRRGAQVCREDGSGFSRCICGEASPTDMGNRGDDSGAGAGDSLVTNDTASTVDSTIQQDSAGDDSSTTVDDLLDDSPTTQDTTPDLADDPTIDANSPDFTTDAGTEDTQAADTNTEPDIGPLPLGGRCESASECESEVCLGIDPGTGFVSFCTMPCCHEDECPYGFGCLQAEAARYCMPSDAFPAAYTFTSITGVACSTTPLACKSGICDHSADLCRGTCCTDADCGQAPCHWSLTGSTLRTFCDPAAILTSGYGIGYTGSPCGSEYDCHHGVCAVQGDPPAGRCADLCCHQSDCTDDTTCALVGGYGASVVRACVEAPTGELLEGELCTLDESCRSGLCPQGRCRRVCCLDDDCPFGERCLPRTTNEGVLVPVCVNPATDP